MNDFTASNGVHIHIAGGNYLSLASPDRDFHDSIVGERAVEALRQFFRAEADELLGRWRWPDNPVFVVYGEREGYKGPGAFVVNELWGSAAEFTRGFTVTSTDEELPFADAARAYFDAHPEPKPWHDAKPGEVWEIATASTGPAPYVVENIGSSFIHVERRLLALDITAAQIVSGRRIWPEVAS